MASGIDLKGSSANSVVYFTIDPDILARYNTVYEKKVENLIFEIWLISKNLSVAKPALNI